MRKNREIKLVFTVARSLLCGISGSAMNQRSRKIFYRNGEAASLSHYVEVLTGRGFLRALGNSIVISVCSALLATVLAFILAYTIHYTNTGKRYKWLFSKAAILPMLASDHYLWICDYLSFGKAGAS